MANHAYRRAKILNMNPGAEEPTWQAEVDNYIHNIALRDSRRLMWIAERAAESTAEKIAEYESELATAKVLGHTAREKELQILVQQYTEDFKFIYSVHRLMQLKNIEAAAEEFAAWFAGKHKKSVKKK